VRAHAPDLVILDVQMPGMNGFEVVEALRKDRRRRRERRAAARVVRDAYDRFALKAFEVHAVDYLLKPFDDERFRAALAAREGAPQARTRRHALARAERVLDLGARLPAAAPPARWLERISIQHAGRIEIVEVADIVWIEAADQYVLIHTASAEFLLRQPLADLERQLDSARFTRIHRSAIVALPHVRRFDRDAGGTGRVARRQGPVAAVSRTRTALLREKLGVARRAARRRWLAGTSPRSPLTARERPFATRAALSAPDAAPDLRARARVRWDGVRTSHAEPCTRDRRGKRAALERRSDARHSRVRSPANRGGVTGEAHARTVAGDGSTAAGANWRRARNWRGGASARVRAC